MDLLTELASNAICGICTALYNEITNFIHLGRDAREMQSRFNALQARQRDINGWLQREGKIPFRVVENWRGEVDGLRQTAAGILTDFALHKRCLAGCCPDCIFRLKLSRRVRDCKSEIQRLYEEGRFEYLNGQFGQTPPPPISEDRPVGMVVGKEIEDSQRQIEDWLKEEDDRSCVIGVYGMGGVGKTTLLKKINKSAMVRTLFDLVIWVTVSQNPNIPEMQNAIARRLGFNLPEGDSAEERGVKLHQRFKDLEEDKKKFLLVLDDVWRGFNVETELGASSSKGRGKIILSTRNVEVCRSMMADRILELKPLKDEEGWELFRRRAFSEDAGDISGIEDIARLVAAECKGLPLAINVVAAAMPRIADRSLWSTALAQLRAVDKDFYELHGDIDRDLFQRLKWSYDSLSPNLKICFLLCAAFPEDTEIPSEDLIEYWISERLVKGRDDEYLVDRGFSFISALRDRSLIQTIGNENQYNGEIEMMVTVHDVLRDFAIRTAEMDQENKCLFRAGQNVQTFPPEEDTRPCTRISLMQNQITTLPPNFQCPHLVSLALAKNEDIEEIPESFLINLPSLKVLDLNRTGIRSLPVCLSFLNQLVYLNLSQTHITELPGSIGDLRSLQFLNLSGCMYLESLSFSAGELKFLRTLNLSVCRLLRVIPREILEVPSLETLDMELSRVMVGEESLNGESKSKDVCVSDLVKFKRLRKFCLQLKSPLTNGVMGKWTKMRHLQLRFENDVNQREFPDDMREMKELEHFEIFACNVVRMPHCICALENLQYLAFHGCGQLRELTGLEELPHLKTLLINGCSSLIALGAGFGRAGGFPMLERLSLWFLTSLQSVVGECGVGEGVLEEGALTRLKYLSMRTCPELRSLPCGMERLRRLEEIRMSVYEWERIVWVDESIKIHLEEYLVDKVDMV